jgi:hypothetical protein
MTVFSFKVIFIRNEINSKIIITIKNNKNN